MIQENFLPLMLSTLRRLQRVAFLLGLAAVLTTTQAQAPNNPAPPVAPVPPASAASSPAPTVSATARRVYDRARGQLL